MIKLSRGRIIVLCLALSAVILMVPAAVSRRVRMVAAEIFEPVTAGVSRILGGLRGRLTAFGRGTDLQQELARERAESEKLRSELAHLRDKQERLLRAHVQQKALSKALARAKTRWSVPVAANVIRRPGRWQSRELIVDLGARHGVGQRSPVLVGNAALGVVSETSASASTVFLVGHPGLVIPARIVETRQEGLLVTSGRRLKLKYVTRGQDVKAGHSVVTSGRGGVFPPGCMIGRIGPGVAPSEGTPFYDLTVVPPRGTVDPEVVWILVGSSGKHPRSLPGTAKRRAN